MAVTKVISDEEYLEADDGHMGWCVKCESFTTPNCEPDARKYTCEICEGATVYGAEEARMLGFFDVSDEEGS